MGVALITGGTKRIGDLIARHFKSQGWEVIAHSSSEADFNYPNQIKAMLESLSVPDLVINNAAIFESDDLSEEILRVNYHAPLQIIEYFATHSQKPICVINMLDAWARAAETKQFKTYRASKLMLTKFTKDSVRIMPNHIRVNGVELGMVLYKQGQSKKKFAKLQKKFPTSVDDILEVVDYIVKNEDIRGEVINIPEWKLAR